MNNSDFNTIWVKQWSSRSLWRRGLKNWPFWTPTSTDSRIDQRKFEEMLFSPSSPAQEWIKRHWTQKHNPPLFNSLNKLLRISKRRTEPPQPQPNHVTHVLGLGSASGRRINNPGQRKRILEVQHGQPSLGRVARTGGVEILGPVALVKDDESVEIGAEPVDYLLETGAELATGVRFADEGWVGRVEDARFEVVLSSVDLRVLHLNKGIGLFRKLPGPFLSSVLRKKNILLRSRQETNSFKRRKRHFQENGCKKNSLTEDSREK